MLTTDLPSGDEWLEQLNARFDEMRAREDALAKIENGEWDEVEDGDAGSGNAIAGNTVAGNAVSGDNGGG